MRHPRVQRNNQHAARAYFQKVAIGYAVTSSPTAVTGNRLAHIKKKIDELLEVIEDEEADSEPPGSKPGG